MSLPAYQLRTCELAEHHGLGGRGQLCRGVERARRSSGLHVSDLVRTQPLQQRLNLQMKAYAVSRGDVHMGE